MARMIMSSEEKAAKKIEDVLGDIRLDAEQTGRYLARQPLIVALEQTQALVRGFLEENDPYLKPVPFNVAYEATEKGQQVIPKPHTVTKPPLWDNSESTEVVDFNRGETGTSFKRRCELLAELFTNDWSEENQDFIKNYNLGFALAYAFSQGKIAYNVKIEKPILDLWLAILSLLEHDNDYDLQNINELYSSPFEETIDKELVTKAELINLFVTTHGNKPEYKEFVEYFDLSLPVIEAVAKGTVTTIAESVISEPWEAMVESLNLSGRSLYDIIKYFESV
jgi:hypothetical protein